MDLETKIAQLKQIYKCHDDFFNQRKVVCRKFCAACCTCNVTATTLEAQLIVPSLDPTDQAKLARMLKPILAGQRFQPQVTINALAVMCMQGETVPDENSDPRWGRCPFLKQEACSIYPVRPFGCRAMLSEHDCSRTGYASMDDLALTVNNIFLQAIEHLDQNGLYGNLSDIIQFILSNGALETGYTESPPKPANGLIRNRPIKMLMIPPEHRKQAEPVLRALGFVR